MCRIGSDLCYCGKALIDIASTAATSGAAPRCTVLVWTWSLLLPELFLLSLYAAHPLYLRFSVLLPLLHAVHTSVLASTVYRPAPIEWSIAFMHIYDRRYILACLSAKTIDK